MKICVCLSIGQNPVSGRPRMAASDRVALELALASGADVTGVYAGPKSDVLTDYLGMGLKQVHHIDSARADIVPLLVEFIRSGSFDLVLTGTVTEAGLSSGMVPYLLAEELSLPLISRVVGIDARAGLTITQAEAGGKRRMRTGAGAAILVVDAKAVQPRLSTVAAQRAGEVITHPVVSDLPQLPELTSQPARKRSTRLKAGSGQAKAAAPIHTNLSAAEAAQTILDFLQAEGHVPALQSITSRQER
jgi:Electron transfer flavoprotein, beta subunit